MQCLFCKKPKFYNAIPNLAAPAEKMASFENLAALRALSKPALSQPSPRATCLFYCYYRSYVCARKEGSMDTTLHALHDYYV